LLGVGAGALGEVEQGLGKAVIGERIVRHAGCVASAVPTGGLK
jgi:hypothetical protein